tara:strand:+ start:33897 stop:34388 length:492 start_codon:yes stop_codon:yes gene_type:complete
MAVTSEIFKSMMKRFSSGVTIVTYLDNKKMGGITVASFCSVSMEPPLVLVCIDNTAYSLKGLQNAGRFGINICNENQKEIVYSFASSKVDKNELIKEQKHTVTEMGVPLLDACLVRMECEIVSQHVEGDHTIFVARVENGEFDRGNEGLVYYKSKIGKFTENK